MKLQDLARAFVQVLGNEKANKQVFNISGEKYVTFDGLAKACAKVSIRSYLSYKHLIIRCLYYSSLYKKFFCNDLV